MKVKQSIIEKQDHENKVIINDEPGFVLIFGERHRLEDPSWHELIDNPTGKDIVYVSTAGEISNRGPEEDTIICNDLSFEKTKVKINRYNISDHLDSLELGKNMYADLEKEDLKYVLLFLDSEVNADFVIEGFDLENENHIPVLGAIAGDGRLFDTTVVGLNQNSEAGEIIAICLYGEHIRVNYGYAGGWWEFGPIKKVTKSEQNVVSEINGQPALEVFKHYLGSEVENLPASALRFPLQLEDKNKMKLVRTIIDIDEENQSMIFAGNIDQSMNVKMLNANVDDLMEASCMVSQQLAAASDTDDTPFVLAISCAGRKWVYEDRVEDEFISIRRWFPNATITGFFSYGEICPVGEMNALHNQSLTLLEMHEV